MANRRRKGAIIGFGFIAETGHLPSYRASEEFEIVAIADVCAARCEAASCALPSARIYRDHRALLAKHAGELDFVDVSVPPYAHAAIAGDALEHNLHVLCEKPLATCVEDARSLITAAERKGRVIFPSHNYKHAPVIEAVRATLGSGVIGRVRMVTLSTFRHTHARGVTEWNEHWRRQRPIAGGGIAMDHGAHSLYLAFEWLRSYPVSVAATMSSSGEFDTEDNFNATLRFPTGLATAQLSWTAGVRKVIYTIHGERGAVRVEDDDIETSLIHVDKHRATSSAVIWERQNLHVSSAWMDASHTPWFAALFKRFALAMDQRLYVGEDALDALHCIEVISAAYASASSGGRERLLDVAS